MYGKEGKPYGGEDRGTGQVVTTEDFSEGVVEV